MSPLLQPTIHLSRAEWRSLWHFCCVLLSPQSVHTSAACVARFVPSVRRVVSSQCHGSEVNVAPLTTNNSSQTRRMAVSLAFLLCSTVATECTYKCRVCCEVCSISAPCCLLTVSWK